MRKVQLRTQEEQEKVRMAIETEIQSEQGTWQRAQVMCGPVSRREQQEETDEPEDEEDETLEWPRALRVRFIQEYPALKNGLYVSCAIFIATFVNAPMKKDFALIAHDFLEHEGKSLDDHVEEYFGEDCVGILSTHESFIRKIMNAIFSAINHGDEYALRLVKKMYSTYYRKEYRHLKRFSRITYDEMLNFKNEDEPLGVTLNRLMIMTSFFDIEMRGDCCIAYIDIYHSYEDGEIELPWEVEKVTWEESLYEESLKEAGRICGDDPDHNLKKWNRYQRFKKKALQYMGFDPEWDRRSSTHIIDLTQELAITRCILMTMNPKHHYTDEELQIYLTIFDTLSCLTSQAEAVDDLMNMTLGRRKLYADELEQSRWTSIEESCPVSGGFLSGKDNLILSRNRSGEKDPSVKRSREDKNRLADGELQEEPDRVPAGDLQKGDLLEKKTLTDQIDLLKAQLSSKDEHLQYAQNLYAQARQALKENEFNIVTADDEHNELATLRDYVYSLTQEDTAPRAENYDSMEKMLRPRKIVIVGGHANWTNQLREKFPDWEFVKPNISVMNDPHILSNADRVYFFTDTICHATYQTFIHKVREQHIPFGYIHSTNIKANIRQIYQDLAAENAA